jgi:UDP-2,3-diacylglucosamine pyrophosphatase LpxH
MLIILSDLHLTDGTCGESIGPDAFYVFAERLDEMAMRASWREDGTYRPIAEINILLLGDILDPLHSTLWLDTDLNTPDYTRPWTDRNHPLYAKKLAQVTQAIIKENADSLRVLRDLKVEIPSQLDTQHQWREKTDQVEVPVYLFYMLGNHDWYYGIKGAAFDAIRAEIVETLGLAQSNAPFPYEPSDDKKLASMLDQYRVYAFHGDRYDTFNFDPDQTGRIHSGLGDVFTVEMLNRFPVEVARQLPELPEKVIANFRELSHVRPALATTLWVSSQIKHNNLPNATQTKIKKIWEKMGSEFLALDVVRDFDKRLEFDSVDKLEIALSISKAASFQTINDLALWVQEKLWGGIISYAKHAVEEKAFKEKKANYIVYGHTHHHEIKPLDTEENGNQLEDQVYFNSGTWHTFYDLAVNKPYEQKFIKYQISTYLLFYKDGERRGHKFETLSATFS